MQVCCSCCWPKATARTPQTVVLMYTWMLQPVAAKQPVETQPQSSCTIPVTHLQFMTSDNQAPRNTPVPAHPPALQAPLASEQSGCGVGAVAHVGRSFIALHLHGQGPKVPSPVAVPPYQKPKRRMRKRRRNDIHPRSAAAPMHQQPQPYTRLGPKPLLLEPTTHYTAKTPMHHLYLPVSLHLGAPVVLQRAVPASPDR